MISPAEGLAEQRTSKEMEQRGFTWSWNSSFSRITTAWCGVVIEYCSSGCLNFLIVQCHHLSVQIAAVSIVFSTAHFSASDHCLAHFHPRVPNTRYQAEVHLVEIWGDVGLPSGGMCWRTRRRKNSIAFCALKLQLSLSCVTNCCCHGHLIPAWNCLTLSPHATSVWTRAYSVSLQSRRY